MMNEMETDPQYKIPNSTYDTPKMANNYQWVIVLGLAPKAPE